MILLFTVNEFFEFFKSQESFKSLEKNEVIHLLQKSLLKEQSLSRDVVNLKNRLSVLQCMIAELKQGNLDIKESFVIAQHQQFGKSSERSTKEEIAASNNESLRISGASDDGESKTPKKRVLKPSERYPNAEIRETQVVPQTPPHCPCCSHEMRDSGLTEESERLSIIPKKFIIDRQIRHKFRCSHCQGSIFTAAGLPSITPGGAFSDALTIDVAVAKYCDLMPIQRFVKAAERMGIKDLPHQSLIESTHQLSQFVRSVYRLIKQEVLLAKVLHADETPHRMLEGDEKDHWYLWGFTTQIAAYFDIRDTRSGEVASGLLKQSLCEYLSSDVFSGYAKAVREVNEHRIPLGLPCIYNVYCNAHSRRNFKNSQDVFKSEAAYFLDRYRSIYFLESQLTTLRQKDPNLPGEKILEIRDKMRIFYEEMKLRAQAEQNNYSSKSSIAKAMNYLIKNYDELTLFLKNTELPIDNNAAERILRNPIIGRKTWYGTHSKQGAETAAVLFSIIESCKLNKISSNKYLNRLVTALHTGEPPFTPHKFAITPSLNS